ncbi:4-carboxymuconolactone decarboxylase [Silvibacterium bohemicum]|uniref:4-carboxymuconolactone decarboxylase n=1 Tax=Silvibacterium bohemicum TaxID=1577686 RepID=A0A841JXF1_9BACT|nr:carboxymuconolactone decarboxylase family protein [Silvibacterium bohemicum]MBB6144419.1 4-carboxymuconolactone decarboxylase [Silvibacterium bohemicum]
MSDSTENLGGRLPLLRPDNLSAAQRQLYSYIDTTLVPWANQAGFIAKAENGSLVGPFNCFLFAPEISQAYLNLVDAEWKHTKLEKRVREVVIVTVGAVWNSKYEVYAHSAVALSTGISKDAVDALASNTLPPDLSLAELIAHRFVKELCSSYRVDDELYREAEGAFGFEGLVNMMQLAGLYLWTSAILNGFQVPVPSEPK